VVALLSLDCAGGISRITVFDRYTVTSALMLGPGKRPLTACRMIALSLPPAFCQGVEVRGVDVMQVAGARRLSNGAILTDSVRLVGMWDGWQDLQRQGVHIMECSTDGDAVVVLVPVVDQRTVSTLRQRYGPVVVNAWLQRARPHVGSFIRGGRP
jgi:hypothetical protein